MGIYLTIILKAFDYLIVDLRREEMKLDYM